MKLEVVSRKDVSYVKLVEDERHPLGITLKDGLKDEAGPVVKSVKAKSVAARSHAVAEGDTLLSVNGRETAGSSSEDIQRMLNVAGPIVDLKILYPVREASISRSGVYRKKRTSAKLQKASGSFGFVLRKLDDSMRPFAVEYPVVSAVKFGGPAQRDGRMQEGDRLLSVDEISLSWLPLPQIAAIMQERTEALFTFEYRIRLLDFPKSKENKIDLEIDIPHTDLGIGLFAHSREPLGMFVGTIRLTSVAERCGAFCEGDIILSVNDIDVQFLTVSKANSLLRNNKQTRRISYVPAKSEESLSCEQFLNCTVAGIPKENRTKTSGSSIRCGKSDKHFNTPVSSNSPTLLRGNNESTSLRQMKQVKTIKRFSDIVKHMTGLKRSLSRITRLAFDKKNMDKNKYCSVCNKSQHSVKLCASCLTKMNAECAQSMEYLRSVIKQFMDVSTEPSCLPSGNNIETSVAESSIKSVAVQALTKTLANAFSHTPMLLESFQNLADKMIKVDAKCDKCKSRINSVAVMVQKLLLLLSLDDGKTETETMIDQMTRCLMSTKFTCEENLGSNTSSLGNTNEAFEPDGDEYSATASFANDVTKFPQNIVEPESDREKKSEEPSSTDVKVEHLNINVIKEAAYFRITCTPSLSDTESLHSETEFGSENDSQLETEPLSGNYTSSPDENLECSDNSKQYQDVMEGNSKKFYKDKGLKITPAKVWRSLDSVLKPRISRFSLPRNGFNLTQNEVEGLENANDSGSRNSNLHPPAVGSASNQLSSNSESHCPDSNDDSTRSSSQHAGRSNNAAKIAKSHCETMDVKLKNDGEGFGIVLGYNSPRLDNTPRIPILTAIKPDSPAKKVGVLDKKDRVLALNRQNVVDLPLRNLEKLKKRISSSRDVVLTVEFDVAEPELEFGTFDVILQRNLKPGLIFENLKEGSPLVVSGVVKGAAAHRSGRLFPGDQLLAVRCVRNEEFYPVFRDYSRNDYVRFTVFRKPIQAMNESPVDLSPANSNPLLFHANSRTGDSFIIKHAYVHPMENTDSLVLDHDITLFRDPASWDFGFLVGENPDTGQAYVTDIRLGGPAHACGVIKRHDRIVKVDGVMVSKAEDCSALSLLTKANERVDLLMRRIYLERTDGQASPT